MKYGIYDTVDKCWLGDDSGPRLFEDHMLARAAAQIWETQVFGTDLGGRYKAQEFSAGSLRLRDKVDVKYDGPTALRRMGVDE